MMNDLVGYGFMGYGSKVSPLGKMFTYLVGAYQVNVMAERENLFASFPIFFLEETLKGLGDIPNSFTIGKKVPRNMLVALMKMAWRELPNEALYWGLLLEGKVWRFERPMQIATGSSVYPVYPYSHTGQQALIELHSHGNMSAGFSPEDNQDETGLRIYTVIGKLNTSCPEILTRVGVYGYHCLIPSQLVYEQLPKYVKDVFFSGVG